MDEDSVQSAFLNNFARKNVVVAQLLIVVQPPSHTNKYMILVSLLWASYNRDISTVSVVAILHFQLLVVDV